MVFTRKLTDKELEYLMKMEEFVRRAHAKSDSHDFSHVLSVTRYAIQIGKAIKDLVDPFVIVASALLHDIGKIDRKNANIHGFLGASIAEEFLESIDVSEDMRTKISRTIVRHTPSSNIPPVTAEEKILFDADCLDRLGLIGLIRGFIGKNGSMEEIMRSYMDKRKTDYSKLNYEISKEIGDWKHQELEGFIPLFEKRLDDRINSIKNIFDELEF